MHADYKYPLHCLQSGIENSRRNVFLETMAMVLTNNTNSGG